MILRSYLGCREAVSATSWRLRNTTAMEIYADPRLPLEKGVYPKLSLGMMGTTTQGEGCNGPSWGI